MNLPSGEKATELMQPRFPSSTATSSPLPTSQMRTVSSIDPDASSLPSGENETETEVTLFFGPSSMPDFFFDATSQIRTISSTAPDTSWPPSGVNTMSSTKNVLFDLGRCTWSTLSLIASASFTS